MTEVSREFMRRLRRFELLFATLTGLLAAAAIMLDGNPATVVAAAFVGFAIIALSLRHMTLVAASLAFSLLVAVVGGAAQMPAGLLGNGPATLPLMVFGFFALAIATNELHLETGVSPLLCFLVLLPIGRLVGLALALWVLTHSATPLVTVLSGWLENFGFGLRSLAVITLIVPIATSQAIKFALHPFYVASGSAASP